SAPEERHAQSDQGASITLTFVATPTQGATILSVLTGFLIICVIGEICFWAIERFVRDGRLANLLKL
ncbi:MAG: hypothetical protein PSV22_22740, partial [Pseudolabrys sp.]|nr:hypothetical protein [Pseudolabrys sp.]